MKRFRFQLVHLDRVELRDPDSAATRELNKLGSEGWHIVHVREDAQHNRELLFVLECEYE